MLKMTAKTTWIGSEGFVSPGDTISVTTEKRAEQLEAEGRAERVKPEAMNKSAPAQNRQRKTQRAKTTK